MKIAHLILAHGEPEQLKRLIERLYHPDADFFIHLDLKTDIAPFRAFKEMGQVYFVAPRIKIYWGGYSMVEATLNGFESILAKGKTYDYINLLSGQDYPLKDIHDIHQFLKENPGKVFTEFLLVNTEWKEAKRRVRRYFFTNDPFPGSYFLENLVSFLLPARKMPEKMEPVGKSQWFTMSSLHANYILEYLLDYPHVINFFKYTWGSDELFFQTLLYNSDYRSDMVNDNLRFIDWSEGKASPKTFTLDDAERLQKSGKLFGRKFNSKVDSKILDYLDEQAAIAASNRPLEE
ncbi:beta-1,6-N-acetylglucosaminyltransferase [Parasediminibacterium sp. JCM 36343]|uniref:beta-1,6-N-acetylglucosaminyltransferase n=1 Tax=Parasediminibacterium sp. JCM 36343 TaxID=3374279 RepID=UPI0039798AD7